mmetsp:Transcript_9795/g.15790  ORF Transcript_9795/g.15790 Transcript_9795/m.15790 type:complete len:157 (+) Transcript_9795:297-767(+)
MGRSDEAIGLLDRFGWGKAFWALNGEALRIYSMCNSSDEVVKAQTRMTKKMMIENEDDEKGTDGRIKPFEEMSASRTPFDTLEDKKNDCYSHSKSSCDAITTDQMSPLRRNDVNDSIVVEDHSSSHRKPSKNHRKNHMRRGELRSATQCNYGITDL